MTKKRPDRQVTCQKPPSQRRGGRPKGSGEGLLHTVATKLRTEEVTALDREMRRLGYKSRSELVRIYIRGRLGV